jgi:hypothetical protein
MLSTICIEPPPSNQSVSEPKNIDKGCRSQGKT